MRTLLVYLFTLLLLAASVHICKADDQEFEDWEDSDELIFDVPMKAQTVIIPSEEKEQKLIVTICDYSYLGEYSCKDLP